MEENKKQGGLSWSQPGAANQNTQSKPASGSPSGFTTTPASVRPAASQPMKSSTPAMKTSMSTHHNGSNTSKIVGGFIAGLIIGALITIIWFTSAGSSSTDTDGTATTTTTGTSQTTTGSTATGNTILPESSLSVASQPAGMEVVVSSASVTVPTWLVVYESSNGQPVRILGAKMFFPENNGTGITIPLLRATQPAQTYILGERIDDGDHMLSLTNDKPVSDASGNALWSSFKTN